MKKFYFLVLSLACCFGAYCQTPLTLTFLAVDSITQNPVLADSVLVMNLTENCDTVIQDPFSGFSFTAKWPVGVRENSTGGPGTFILNQNHPNPFRGETFVTIFRAYGGLLNLVLYDALGKQLAACRGVSDKGSVSFAITASGNRVLYLVVYDARNNRSIKIVSTGQGDENTSIRFAGHAPDMAKTAQENRDNPGFIYYLGNQLMFTAFASGYHDNSIFDAPVADTTYTFHLAPLTIAVVPTVTTAPVTGITQSTATSGGDIISDGGAAVTARGVCWGTSSNPTTAGDHTTDGSGTGVFVSNLGGLAPNTPYFLRAYATNSAGTSYGNELGFTTSCSTYFPVSVTITPSANPVCQGTPVTFTAVPVNGGSSPVFQWFLNGIAVGINSPAYTYVPSNGDVVNCVMTSNAQCVTGSPATSNPVTMTVTAILPVSLTITVSANPSCQGQPVTFTAVPVNGGPTPAYQWYKNSAPVAGGNGPTYSYVPATGDQLYCLLTSGLACVTGNPATSNPVTMTVASTLPVSVSVTASANNICQGQAVTFTAVVVNGGASPVYQWRVNSVFVGSNTPVYTYIPANGDQVWCQVSSSLPCATGSPAYSNTMSMVVMPGLQVSITIMASANPSCLGQAVTFTAIPVNGGGSPVFQWKVNGFVMGTNSPTYVFTPVNGDIITCVLISDLTCTTGNPANSNTITMTVNPLPAAPAAGTNVASGTQIVWNWNTVAGATGYKWNTVNNYATATDMGTSTTKTETGLTPGITYTRYVWAYSICGASGATTLTQLLP